jgi:hypothetical protein
MSENNNKLRRLLGLVVKVFIMIYFKFLNETENIRRDLYANNLKLQS